ncbi:hypothetical protein PPGU19_092910 (plasmid) [Paraburkholderia sp. PGU19]|nr:hypothetical protein PPGU19_092910 [Paraburkholderia sp. PGU19]
MCPKRWSDDLLALTQDLLQRDSCSHGLMLPMKHIDGRFGMALSRAESGEYRVIDRANGVVYVFACVNALIEEGWAID